MLNVEIPEIPFKIQEEFNKKKFGASDIKWIKTVNDDTTGKFSSSSAYLSPDDRLIKKDNNFYFCLQASEHSKDSLKKADIGDIIVLYQKLENQSVKCFTHLVTPIGNDLVRCPYEDNGWDGRWVKAIAMTGNKVADSIPALTKDWKKMSFKKFLNNLGYPKGEIYKIANSKNLSEKSLSKDELTNLQNYIWYKFDKWKTF